jgi:uncharacterized membrane protein YqiK
MLVAQCTSSSAACELPTGLPWYFGVAIAVVWLAFVVGAFAVARRLLQARRERRLVDERRAIGRTSRTDVEPW